MDKQSEYLRLLQEKNRLKKIMTSKTKDELEKERLEQQFSIHFSGANANEKKSNTNRIVGTKVRGSSSILSALVMRDNKNIDDRHNDENIKANRDNTDFDTDDLNNLNTPIVMNGVVNPVVDKTSSSIKKGWSFENRYLTDRIHLNTVENVEEKNGLNVEYIPNVNESVEHGNDKTHHEVENIITQSRRIMVDDLETEQHVVEKNDSKAASNTETNQKNEELIKKIIHLDSDQKKALLDLLKKELSRPVANTVTEATSEEDVDQDPMRIDKALVAAETFDDWIDIKIRIYSNWKNTKFFSIKAIRLQSTLEGIKGVENQQFDILHLFDAFLNPGEFTHLPITSPSIQLLPLLVIGLQSIQSIESNPPTNTSINYVSAQEVGVQLSFKSATNALNRQMKLTSFQNDYEVEECWMAAFIRPDIPFEIKFSGHLRNILDRMTIDKQPHRTWSIDEMKSFKDNLQISIWNFGTELMSTESISKLICSPVKEMDIYVNNKCIWTGELSCKDSKNSTECNIEQEKKFFTLPQYRRTEHLISNPPSLSMGLFYAGEVKQSHLGKEFSKPSEPPIGDTFAAMDSKKLGFNLDYQPSNLSPNVSPSKENIPNISRPSWLQADKPIFKKKETSLRNEAQAFHSIKDEISTDELVSIPFENKPNHEESSPTKSTITNTNRATKPSRRNRTHLLTEVNRNTLPPKGKSHAANFDEKESVVRQSIHAVEHAEMNNFGRLGVSGPIDFSDIIAEQQRVLVNENIPLVGKNAVSLSEQTSLESITSPNYTISNKELKGRRNRVRLNDPKSEVFTNGMQVGMISEVKLKVPEQKIPSNRLNRMDQIQNSLAGLADLLSGLPTHIRPAGRQPSIKEEIHTIISSQHIINGSIAHHEDTVPQLANSTTSINFDPSPYQSLENTGVVHLKSKLDGQESFFHESLFANSLSSHSNSNLSDSKLATVEMISNLANREFEQVNLLNNSFDDNVSNCAIGKTLKILIISTWGDRYYVGLNGFELFDASGEQLLPSKDIMSQFNLSSSNAIRTSSSRSNIVIKSIRGDPDGIYALPTYKSDPRRSINLINGINFTKNDLHVWLTPQKALYEKFKTQSSSEPLQRIETILEEDLADNDRLNTIDMLEQSVTKLVLDPIYSKIVLDSSKSDDPAEKYVREARQDPLEHGPTNTDEYIAKLEVEFNEPVQLSMMRIFNYNKSRTHNQRGVRHCQIYLDDYLLFEGELKVASGTLLDTESESQELYFTDAIDLKNKLINSRSFIRIGEEIGIPHETKLDSAQTTDAVLISRPKTAASHQDTTHGVETLETTDVLEGSISIAAEEFRAFMEDAKAFSQDLNRSKAQNQKIAPKNDALDKSNAYLAKQAQIIRTRDEPILVMSKQSEANTINESMSLKGSQSQLLSCSCRSIQIEIHTTWGDESYVGMCGIQILQGDGLVPVKIRSDQLQANPEDLSSIGCFNDERVLSNLINGINDTAEDSNMWLIPFTKGGSHVLNLNLGTTIKNVTGIRLWNYNKSTEDVLRGIRDATITFGTISQDGVGQQPASGSKFNLLIRLAPGCHGVRFSQLFLLQDLVDRYYKKQTILSSVSKAQSIRVPPSQLARQDYETVLHPSGMLWKFTFFDNWDDQYYIGLDRIELYDVDGQLINLKKVGATVTALPYSLMDIFKSGDLDPRIPEQLFEPRDHSKSVANNSGWLCPLSRCMTYSERLASVQRIQREDLISKNPNSNDSNPLTFPINNVLFINFNYPKSVSYIKMFNYSKTPARGVRDFSIEVDNKILYMGTLIRSDMEKRVQGLNGVESCGQAILFTDNSKLQQENKNLINFSGASDQDVLCINERQVMIRSKTMYNQQPPNPALEGIQTDLNKRPTTGQVKGYY